MTELSKVEALASQLDEKDRLAIAGLIDLKTDDDRDKVLRKLDTIESRFDAKFEAMDIKFDAKFEAMDAKFDTRLDAMESKFDTRLEAMDNKFDAKFEAIDTRLDALENRFGDFKWFVGAGFALLGILTTALRLL